MKKDNQMYIKAINPKENKTLNKLRKHSKETGISIKFLVLDAVSEYLSKGDK